MSPLETKERGRGPAAKVLGKEREKKADHRKKLGEPRRRRRAADPHRKEARSPPRRNTITSSGVGVERGLFLAMGDGNGLIGGMGEIKGESQT